MSETNGKLRIEKPFKFFELVSYKLWEKDKFRICGECQQSSLIWFETICEYFHRQKVQNSNSMAAME